MPRFLIERTFFVTEPEMQEVGRRSKQIAADDFPNIAWEHSHVILDEDGNVRTVCVYAAPDKEILLQHAKQLGQHRVDNVREIAGDVTPADFPLG